MRPLGQGSPWRDVRALRVALGQSGLSQPSGWLPFCSHDTLPVAISTSPINVYSATIPRALTIRTWLQTAYVATTNNGSNYWTIALVETDLTSITTVTTASLTAGVWGSLASTGIDVAVGTADIGLLVRVTKTGSPGNLYLQGPAVFVT